MTQDELDLVDADDLIKALARRYDAVVVGCCVDMGGDQGTDYLLRYTGRDFEALGLAHYLADEISGAIEHRPRHEATGPAE